MSAAKSCRPRAAASETGVAPSEVGVYAATVTGGPLGSMHTYVLFCPGQGVAVFGRAGFSSAAVVLRWGPKVASPSLAMLGAESAPVAELDPDSSTPAAWWSSLAGDLDVAVRILEGSGAAKRVLSTFRSVAGHSRRMALLLDRMERAESPAKGVS